MYDALRIHHVVENVFNSVFDERDYEYPTDGFINGLLFSLGVSARNQGYSALTKRYDHQWECREDAIIRILITANRNLFISYDKHRNLPDVDLNSFENVSNHHTCWSSGVSDIAILVNEMAHRVASVIPEEHRYPVDTYIQVQPLHLDLFKCVKVKLETDDVKNQVGDSYWKKIVEIHPGGKLTIV